MTLISGRSTPDGPEVPLILDSDGLGSAEAGPFDDRAGLHLGGSGGDLTALRGSGFCPLPADGIYAGWYQRSDGAVHPTAISLGRRPMFYVNAPVSLLEAHLLDFDGDLYDERAAVRFVARLRGEERFDSVDALVAQMRRDCDGARSALAGA